MSGTLLVALIAFALAARAAYRVWRYPFTPCRRCNGGRRWAPTGRTYRRCARCGGSGEKLRLSRRLWNWYQR